MLNLGKLDVTIKKAKITRAENLVRLDSYANIVFREQEWRTRIINKTPHPIYARKLQIDIHDATDFEDALKLSVFNNKTSGLIGDATVKLADLTTDSANASGEHDTQFDIKCDGQPTGQVFIKAVWTPTEETKVQAQILETRQFKSDPPINAGFNPNINDRASSITSDGTYQTSRDSGFTDNIEEEKKMSPAAMEQRSQNRNSAKHSNGERHFRSQNTRASD